MNNINEDSSPEVARKKQSALTRSLKSSRPVTGNFKLFEHFDSQQSGRNVDQGQSSRKMLAPKTSSLKASEDASLDRHNDSLKRPGGVWSNTDGKARDAFRSNASHSHMQKP